MNQLLWYYADLEKQKCLEDMKANITPEGNIFVGGKRSSKVKKLYILLFIGCYF